MTKVEAYNYIGVSRATFDNYVNKGLLPKGNKRQGSNTKYWNK
jgi:predicted DNA-binding transcriptional regulator AlpA